MDNTNPIVQYFRITRLHGYKDVTIDFKSSVRILIAGNGSGKTTVLNALHSFLRRRFHRLRLLDFHSIECQFNTLLPAVTLYKSQIPSAVPADLEKAAHLAARSNVRESEILEFIRDEYTRGEIYKFRLHRIVRQLFTMTPYTYEQIGAMLDDVYDDYHGSGNSGLEEISTQILNAIGQTRLLYLPTYRRIEMPLLSSVPPRLKRTGQYQYQEQEKVLQGASPAEAQHIIFGLADVDQRLAELSEEIERISNLEYRSTSATIIDEALGDRIRYESSMGGDLPDIESLARFLSRVSQGKNSQSRIESIANLYRSGEIHSEQQLLLRYFLRRIGSVIEKTRETEAMLEKFVAACNAYLRESSDEKILTYDPEKMRVLVVNTWTGNDIPMSELSSGEKQLISIFAKLYLYDVEQFVLIDEPELSLSIDWQRRILPSMVDSGSVRQLLAITHSPFIFDNRFDPYAGHIDIVRSLIRR